ncbi:galactose-3-O-sulfotransferase 3-like [Pollicipes pollicipes]|uniref:galactose-3-O-sulfotransferase 3-like n=1 Tax=Pollicipes pollicipes TaxID=41117 RepID=UPI001884A34D|nr:galactose-3-O-sulfotransferase 3-like [Pollicipes pollicipes]
MRICPGVLCLLSATVLVITAFYALRLEDWSLWIAEEEPVCPKPSAVFFLKLHKCASSSVQNILLRLGEQQRLQLALPRRGNYFGHPQRFRANMVHRSAGADNATYRLLLHHMRLDPAQVTKVVGPDAVWVTVMRRPVDQFISMFEYYNLQDVWNMSLAEFAAAPTDLLPATAFASHFFPNQMSFDLGYDVAALQADDQLQEAMLEDVQRRFHLVMITDLLDESLVLMRYRFCLDWDDVVAFRHNVRPPSLRSAAAHNLTLRRQLRHHLAADGALYSHFHRLLREALPSPAEAWCLNLCCFPFCDI